MIPRTFLSSIGDITIERRYYRCADCGAALVPWDQWAGLGHRNLSPDARRMLTLAGMSWPFDLAAERLKELCHIHTSDDTIERVCQEEGQRAQRFIKEAPEPAREFAAAAGEAEFYSDGVKVNTVGGWRELRLNVFARREAAAPATPAQWKERVLPKQTVRVAFCGIGHSNVIGSSWAQMVEHLGLDAHERLSVLGDGARWIWDEAAKRFKLIVNAEWCVDVFHVSEHIHGCGKQIYGEGPMARQWAEMHLNQLIEMEGPAFIRLLKQDQQSVSGSDAKEAVRKLCAYLEENQDSLWYRTRLAQGLAIGSGLIEGACKTVIGNRLKVNSARWRVRRCERIAALRCLDYSGQWQAFWQPIVA